MGKYRLHDIVSLKKGHPCGENKWMILRTGVDIKLKCMGCQREIWLERPEFERRLRKIQNEDGKFISIVNFERED
ncbi:MAG: DUF951 domain-containing protein [Tissierellia bacterium]|nr:DUF951 domain-containing protein [Tissierellia bacterium]